MRRFKEVAADCLMKVFVALVMVVILFWCWRSSQSAHQKEG